MRRLLAPVTDGRTYRTLLFLVTALPVGGVASGVLLAGWTLSLLVALSPAILAVLLGFRVSVSALARVEAALARDLLELDVRPAGLRATRGIGFWRRALAVVRDRAFWKQQAYLLLRFALGGTLAIVELSLLGAGVASIALPVWYRWSDSEVANGWRIDTLPRSLLGVAAGAIAVLVGLHLLGPIRALSRALASSLLGGDTAEGAEAAVEPWLASRGALRRHVAGAAALAAILVAIWGLSSTSYFWPFWVILPLGAALAVHASAVLLTQRRASLRGRWITYGVALHAAVAATLFLFLVAIWAFTTRGYFWPAWPLLGLASAVAVHAAVAASGAGRRRELERRIDVLETTRAGAVDAQESELRRIERDLHDGAQARLVALGMSIGMAEQKLRTDPEGARAMLAEARRGAREALEELRDLARGIHPPVLTDRGLEAAIAALADRSPVSVTVSVEPFDRPPPAVESAAYFVVAEALANATKHALAEDVAVHARRTADTLVVEVLDDGRGGADPAGGGLTGLRHRVEALDGILTIRSPVGGPTTVTAELPCAS